MSTSNFNAHQNPSSDPNAKTVLVTGATRGIGLKFAELYIKRGWNVIGAARDLDKAEQLKALSPYKIVQLDTSDEDSIARAAKELEGEPIDLLINNAGILIAGDLETTTKADLIKQFDVNTIGPFLVTRAFVPSLKNAVAARGAASVVQIGSFLGSVDFMTTGENAAQFGIYYGYCTSKAAINMLNANLAHGLKRDGIATFVVHPGFVATDMNGHADGAVSADTSVNALMATFSKLSLTDTGKFFDFDGEGFAW